MKPCIHVLVGLVILTLASPALAQECFRDEVTNDFICGGNGSSVNVGPGFTGTPTASRGGAAASLIQELVKEEEEQEGRGASADDGGFGLFVTGTAAFEELDETTREPGSDSDRFGAIVGADYRHDRFVVGLALDYYNEDIEFDDDLGDTDSNEFGVQLFGIFYPIDSLYLTAAGRFAYDEYDFHRNVAAGNVSGDTDGTTFSVLGGGGYDLDLGYGVVLGLSGLLEYERTDIDGYAEHGDPGGLEYDDDDVDTLTSILEVNASKAFGTPVAVLVPEAFARYLHEFENDSRTIRAESVDLPGNMLSFETNNPDRNYFNLGAGLTAIFPLGWSAFANYQVEVAHRFREEQVVSIGLRKDF